MFSYSSFSASYSSRERAMLSHGGNSMRQQIQLREFAQFTIDVPTPLRSMPEKQRGTFGLSPEAQWCSYSLSGGLIGICVVLDWRLAMVTNEDQAVHQAVQYQPGIWRHRESPWVAVRDYPPQQVEVDGAMGVCLQREASSDNGLTQFIHKRIDILTYKMHHIHLYLELIGLRSLFARLFVKNRWTQNLQGELERMLFSVFNSWKWLQV